MLPRATAQPCISPACAWFFPFVSLMRVRANFHKKKDTVLPLLINRLQYAAKSRLYCVIYKELDRYYKVGENNFSLWENSVKLTSRFPTKMLKSIFLKKTFRTWQRENIVKIHFTSITGSRGITNFLGSISTFHSVELVPALLFAKAQYLPICLGPQFRNWSIQRRPCSSRSEKKIFTFFNAFVKYHNSILQKIILSSMLFNDQ